MGVISAIRSSLSELTVARTERAASLNEPTPEEMAATRTQMESLGASTSVIELFFGSLEKKAGSVLTEAEVAAFSGAKGLQRGGSLHYGGGLNVSIHGFVFHGGSSDKLYDIEAELEELCGIADSLGLVLNGLVVQQGIEMMKDNVYYYVENNIVKPKRAVGFLFADGTTITFS